MRQKTTVLESIQELYAEDKARLARLTEQRSEIDAKISGLQETMRATDLFRERVEAEAEPVSRDGTITAQVVGVVERILRLEGPTHRKELLERVKEAGIHFASDEKKQLNTFASYLTGDERFRPVSAGSGVWELVDHTIDEDTEASESETADDDTSNEEVGAPLRLVQ